MSIKRGDKVRLIKNFDLRHRGGPLLVAGLVGKFIKRTRSGRLWIEFEGEGPNGYFNESDVGHSLAIFYTKEIKLSSSEFVVELGEKSAENPKRYTWGKIESKGLKDGNKKSRLNASIDTLESFIIAAAVVGLDISSKDFIEAVETVVDQIGNEYGD